MYVCMYVCMNTCERVICMYVCMYIYIYIYIYIYTYTIHARTHTQQNQMSYLKVPMDIWTQREPRIILQYFSYNTYTHIYIK